MTSIVKTKNKDTSKHSTRDRCGLALLGLGFDTGLSCATSKVTRGKRLVKTNPNPTPTPRPIYFPNPNLFTTPTPTLIQSLKTQS